MSEFDRPSRARPGQERFVAPLEDANERLGRAWGQVAHLHAVMDTPPLREAYNASLPKVTQYWTELGQNQQLFEKYKALHDSAAKGRVPVIAPLATSNSVTTLPCRGLR